MSEDKAWVDNLAGADPQTRNDVTGKELAEAGIPFAEERAEKGLDGSVVGVLKGPAVEIVLTRRWAYWEADGLIPYATALRLWESPEKDAIRVQGYSGGCHPRKFALDIGPEWFVLRYHLDSVEGLQAFAAILREDGVVE